MTVLRESLAWSGSITSTVSGSRYSIRATWSVGRGPATGITRGAPLTGVSLSRMRTSASDGWLRRTTVSRWKAWPGKMFCLSE